MSTSSRISRPPRAVASSVVFHTVMTIAALVFVVPLVWMVFSSFKTKREIFENPFSLPQTIDLGVWAAAWEKGNLGAYVVNSLIVTTASVFLILIFAIFAAFAFSRLKFRLSKWFLLPFVLGLLLPVQSYLTAQSRLFDSVYLLNTRWALIVPYVGLGLSLAVFLLKSYLDSLPHELFEAARMDGAGDLRILFQVVMPLMRPGLATVATFSVLSCWNEFLLAMLYIQDDELLTIPVGLLAFSGKYSTDYPLLFAALSIITIPMIGIYVIFHRQVVSGITEGSVH